MKDYTVTRWDTHNYPNLSRDWLGIIPEFFIHATSEADTLESVANAMDAIYGFGEFQYPFSGTVDSDGVYRAPEDEPLDAWAAIDYRDSLRLYFYPYSIVALVDLDTRESKIGRFD